MSSDGQGLRDGELVVLPASCGPAPTIAWEVAELTRHRVIGERYHRLAFRSARLAEATAPGQFVMVTLGDGSDIVLPRPMAIHRRRPQSGEVEIVLSAVGRGTAAMARLQAGDTVRLIGPLGRGFVLPEESGEVLLLGRGIGVAAVMTVAEAARALGRPVTAVLSAATASSIIGLDDCKELGVTPLPVSDDLGTSSVPDLESLLHARYDDAPPRVVVVCGSARLTDLCARLAARWRVPAQVSIEANMACGLGYCHGCAAPIPTEPSREGPMVCVDGPVFGLSPVGNLVS